MPRKVVMSARQRRAVDTAKARAAVARKAAPAYDETKNLAELTSKARKRLPKTAFAIPETQSYPIHDIAHARNALARVSQFGTAAEKSRVRAAVASKYPELGKKKK